MYMNLHMCCTRTYVNSLKVNVNEITIVSDMEFNDSPISFQFLKGKCELGICGIMLTLELSEKVSIP